ncbi:hypothetical protein BLNAU_9300 [Blattamonas nauphoetae]|uniref:MMS19 nucleotide excision repair protein n=1 Tax=Blattamonas nauphoetae TaxID=2049346 RepID=A0ABQ9XWB1_9EUKA|nr:hypothetical protein BLNAU_9300 [Blattamonas nauphoetae]
MSGYDATTSKDSLASLEEPENMKTLSSYVTSKCEAKEVIEWKDLMEWFVCAVIGLELKASSREKLAEFDWDDVMIDELGILRIIVVPSNVSSSPPNSPQSFSDDISSLSLLFISLIEQLSTSACLSKRIDQHFQPNLLASVLPRLMNYLIKTGYVFPVRTPLVINKLIAELIKFTNTNLPKDVSLFDAFLMLPVFVDSAVHGMESGGFVVTNVNPSAHSVKSDALNSTRFGIILEPELVAIRKQFDPELFEEARRILLWKEFLERVASGEEVVTDSDLTPNEDPKTGCICGRVRGEFDVISAFVALFSTHLPRSTPQLFTSESLELLTIVHSLLTSPLPPSLPTSTLTPSHPRHHPTQIMTNILTISQFNNPSPTERFSSTLFDEADDEVLARSLIRCNSVCGLVGPEKCISDIPTFFDRTVSVLGSSNAVVREAAFSLFNHLTAVSSIYPLFPRLLTRLRSGCRTLHPQPNRVINTRESAEMWAGRDQQ